MHADTRGRPLPTADGPDCQLMALQLAGIEVLAPPRITPGYLIRATGRALLHPSLLVKKARQFATVRREARRLDAGASAGTLSPLGLKPGDWVRVKSAAAIRATLDADDRFERLAYMDVVMDRFCGRTLQVRTRVERFFDERTWRMMKLRNVVLLEGAYCLPDVDAPVSWAGCQRHCFLFWKEAWLERVPGPGGG